MHTLANAVSQQWAAGAPVRVRGVKAPVGDVSAEECAVEMSSVARIKENRGWPEWPIRMKMSGTVSVAKMP